MQQSGPVERRLAVGREFGRMVVTQNASPASPCGAGEIEPVQSREWNHNAVIGSVVFQSVNVSQVIAAEHIQFDGGKQPKGAHP